MIKKTDKCKPCGTPKTKIELLVEFGRNFRDYLDNNKAEACIFFTGIAGALIAAAIVIANKQGLINQIAEGLAR